MAGALAGKVALVTGASSCIGAAAAVALSEAGAVVAVSARRAERLRELVEKNAMAGITALALPSDVSDEAEAIGVVEETVSHLGRIDILVNSAGVVQTGGVELLPLDEWRRVIDINLMGSLYICKAAIPHMKATTDVAPM